MDETYKLTPGQQKAWNDQFQPLPNQAEIARALTKSGGKEGSWKTQLTSFFKGEEAGLRAVFNYEKRIEIVARELGLKPHDLRKRLAAARGIPIADDLLDTRIPGFEDLGAVSILDVFFPRLAAGGSYSINSQDKPNSDDLVDLIVAVALHGEPERGRGIFVQGPPGSGRSSVVKAVAARLKNRGHAVTRWVPGTVARGVVQVALDLDRLTPDLRQRLSHEIHDQGTILLATTSDGDTRSEFRLGGGHWGLRAVDPVWGGQFLIHMQGLLERKWSRRVDLGGLIAWIRDDPLAAGLGSKPESLGFLARHVAEGGGLPIRHDDFVRLAVGRWSRVLRQQDNGAEATFLELVGAKAIGRVAATACLRHDWSVALAEISQAMVDSSDGMTRRKDWPTLGLTGTASVVDAVVKAGVFHAEGDRLRPAQTVFFASALGMYLAHRLGDDDLIRAVVLDPEWHDALSAAVGVLNDPSPIIDAIDRQPAWVRCQAFQAYTRVLLSGGQPSNPEVVAAAFRRSLLWWTAWCASDTTDASCPGQMGPRAEALVAGMAPLIALGFASQTHRKLPGITADHVLGALDDEMTKYLMAMGKTVPTIDQIQDALFFAAPFQSHAILDPSRWEGLVNHVWEGKHLPFGIGTDEYKLWWRLIAVKRLEGEPDRDSRIAGTAPGHSVSAGMNQPEGTHTWADALIRRFESNDPQAAQAFADSVRFTLGHPGRSNTCAVRRVWDSVVALGLRRLEPLRVAVRAAIPPPPDKWYADAEFLSWLLGGPMEDDARRELWEAWTATNSDRIPWRSFLDGGIEPMRVAAWALATMPGNPVRSEGEGDPNALLKFMVADPKDRAVSPQSEALDHLAEHGNADVLEFLLDAPIKWMGKATQRLQVDAPARLRRRALKRVIADTSDWPWSLRLVDVVLHPDDRDLWMVLAESARTWPERLVRLCQLALLAPDDAEFAETVTRALTTLECALMPPEDGRPATMACIDARARALEEWAHGDFEQLREQVASEVDVVFGQIGHALGQAYRAGRPNMAPLLSLVFDSDVLWAAVLPAPSKAHWGWWWSLASRLLGGGYLVRRVKACWDRIDESHRLEAVRALLSDVASKENVLLLVRDPVLGRLATRAFAENNRVSDTALILEALEGQPVGEAAGEPDPSTLLLVKRFASVDQDGAVNWMAEHLARSPRRLQHAWWSRMLSAFQMGPVRGRALELWYSRRQK